MSAPSLDVALCSGTAFDTFTVALLPRMARCHPYNRRDAGATALFFYSSLMRAGDAHIFSIFRDRTARNLNALGLKNSGDLLVCQRAPGILFLDQFLNPALQDKQRSVAALGTVHAFTEEVAQLEYA